MYRRLGFITLLMAMCLTANAEQTAIDTLGPPDAAADNTAQEAIQQEPAAETAPAQEQQMEQAGFSKGTVFRSAFTSAVENREPTDSIENVSTEQNQLYFFTELRDMSGQTAKHRWEHDGKVMAEVEFNVKGNRWRVWSSKNFVPGWEGDWKVSVINGAGDVISEKTFTYETASASQTMDAGRQGQNADPAAQ